MLKAPPPKRLTFRRRRRRRRQQFVAVLVLVILAAGAGYAYVYSSGGASGEEGASSVPSGQEGRAPAPQADGPAAQEEAPARKSEPPPEPPDTPEAAAYLAVAPEMPGVVPESVKAVYRSRMNASWASVHILPSGEAETFVVFAQREGDVWEAKKSIRLDEPNYPENDLVALDGIPRDLLEYVYPENLFVAEAPEPKQERVDREGLPDVGPASFPPPEPVIEDVPDSEREKVGAALEEARQRIDDYSGVAGFYVIDGQGGYGVRPDEEFFSASVIKVPVMVAVYRKIDEGEFALSDTFETQEEDWAAGAGWLQWDPPGKSHTVEDYLYMMMTQSDNVATNALIRKVGGMDHVNEVARSMGVRNTLLYQKVSSERAAVPALDNRTTPRDMAKMMAQIATGEAASDISCKDMIDLMYQNELDWWLDAGLPTDVWAANKAGWLYEVYDEVGIVQDGDHPYAVAIMSKYGPENPDEGAALIEGISRSVWEAQQDEERVENDSAAGGS